MAGDRLLNGETASERKARILSGVKINGIEWLELECAMWTVELLEAEYQKLSDPFKPVEVKQFENEVPIYDRKMLDKSFYADNPQIDKYYKRKRSVELDNKSNKEWLEDVLRVLSEHEKAVECNKVKSRLIDFK